MNDREWTDYLTNNTMSPYPRVQAHLDVQRSLDSLNQPVVIGGRRGQGGGGGGGNGELGVFIALLLGGLGYLLIRRYFKPALELSQRPQLVRPLGVAGAIGCGALLLWLDPWLAASREFAATEMGLEGWANLLLITAVFAAIAIMGGVITSAVPMIVVGAVMGLAALAITLGIYFAVASLVYAAYRYGLDGPPIAWFESLQGWVVGLF